jgi:glycine/D-amino acid oxidase-like deaminating enzyme
MNKPKTHDYLIIGLGLAGSLLAWELLQRGCTIMVVDNGLENASQVAAGLINPVTGMRLVKSADIEHLLPSAKRCYEQLSQFFSQDFYIEKPMLRQLDNELLLANAHKRLADLAYKDYVKAIIPADLNSATPCYLEQQQTGYLQTRLLLSRLKQYFIERGCYRQSAVNYQDIQLAALRWQDISFKKIIFCEGHHATQNPNFSWLPFQLVKGEILTLQHQSQLPDVIVNFGDWLIPLDKQRIRLGASFDREHLNSVPTLLAKNALLQSLKHSGIHLSELSIIDHQANIRPCTLDKQPFIGEHPNLSQLLIFNGFGAKGSLQIPKLCQLFVDALLTSNPYPSSIARYYATHFPH